MNLFDRRVERMTGRHYRRFGRPAQFTRGRATRMVPVIVDEDLNKWSDIDVADASAVLHVPAAYLPGRPQRGDRFTLETGREFRAENVVFFEEGVYGVLVIE